MGPTSDELLRWAADDPQRVVDLARELIVAAKGANDERRVSVVRRASGVARRTLGDIDGSLADLRVACAAAQRCGWTVGEGLARTSLAATLAYRGNLDAAERELDLAGAMLTGPDLGRVHAQRAGVDLRRGGPDTALAGLNRAEELLAGAGDDEWLARVLGNRGLLRAYQGDAGGALDDLERSRSLYRSLGMRSAEVEMIHNLAFAAGRTGRLADSLRLFSEAEAGFLELGYPLARNELSRAEVLLSAGLPSQAAERSLAAARAFERGGNRLDEGEARLLLARALLAAKHHKEARTHAASARDAFTPGRHGWAEQAHLVELQAALHVDMDAGSILDAALGIAAEAGPFADLRARATLVAAEAAARCDDPRAGELLEAGRVRSRRGSWDLSIEERLVAAMVAGLQGDERRAAGATAAAVERMFGVQGAIGSLELRAGLSSRLAVALSGRVTAAAHRGSARRLLAWIDRSRAASLASAGGLDRAAPLDTDPESVRLRHLERLARFQPDALDASARAEGRKLRRRLLDRAASRRGPGAAASSLDLERLFPRLEGRVLLVLEEVEGTVHTVSVAGGRVRHRAVAASREVKAAAGSMAFRLRRAARSGTLDSDAVGGLARSLDGIVPPEARGWDRVVVCPPPGWPEIPWALIPSLSDAAIAVAPSPSIWLNLVERHVDSEAVLVASGPGLDTGHQEVCRIRAVHAGAKTLTRDEATVEAVAGHMSGARLVHLAAHGRFEAENPMFSGVDLWDGPLLVQDVAAMDDAPETVVLSSCLTSLKTAIGPGDAISLPWGLAAAGVRNVVASPGLVPDTASTVDLMAEVHRRLAVGDDADLALAGAIVDAADLVARSSFVVYGAG